MSRYNKIMSALDAVSRIKDGDRVMVGGFGLRGVPYALIDALVAHGAKNLTLISNDLGSPGIGLGKLLRNKQLCCMIGSYYSWNTEVVDANKAGEIKVTLVPQGTLAESIRAAGHGIPAYYTPTSAGTDLAIGKETRVFNGVTYVLEQAIPADVALVKAYKADTLGNLVYCKTGRNFNPSMAMAAKYSVALVDEIVEAGDLDPEAVITPHIFVDAVVKESKNDS